MSDTERRCGNCRFWGAAYDCPDDLGDHQSGTCSWVPMQRAPFWLSPSGALVEAALLAGGGKDCRAFEEKRDETDQEEQT